MTEYGRSSTTWAPKPWRSITTADASCGVVVTGPIGYLRMHGRNSTKWFSKNAAVHEKYDYLYAPEEVDRLVKVAEDIRSRTEKVFVIANNHFEGKGPANAMEIAHGLTGEAPNIPPTMLSTYPQLARLSLAVESARSAGAG